MLKETYQSTTQHNTTRYSQPRMRALPEPIGSTSTHRCTLNLPRTHRNWL